MPRGIPNDDWHGCVFIIGAIVLAFIGWVFDCGGMRTTPYQPLNDTSYHAPIKTPSTLPTLPVK